VSSTRPGADVGDDHPWLQVQCIERLAWRLLLLALGPLEPPGTANPHHGRQDAAADRMTALRINPGRCQQSKKNGNPCDAHKMSHSS
jgi:hypothetical protein